MNESHPVPLTLPPQVSHTSPQARHSGNPRPYMDFPVGRRDRTEAKRLAKELPRSADGMGALGPRHGSLCLLDSVSAAGATPDPPKQEHAHQFAAYVKPAQMITNPRPLGFIQSVRELPVVERIK